MSADLCAFFVKHFHVFKKPVEYLEFSINFYTDKHSKLTQNFLNLSEEKKKGKKMVFLLSWAISFTLLQLLLQIERIRF